MYYKVRSRKKSFKPYLRSSEQYKEESRINNRKRNDDITSRRKNIKTNSDEDISSRTFRKANPEEHTRRTNRRFRVDNKNTQKSRKNRRLQKDYSGESTSRSKRRKGPAVGMPLFITENRDGEYKIGRKREKYREQEYSGGVYLSEGKLKSFFK